MTSIPTGISRPELELLQSVSTGKRVYEAGALLGASTVALAEVARVVVSVDPHSGYPRARPRDSWNAYKAHTGHLTNVIAHRARFQDVQITNVDLAWADLTGQGPLMREFLLSAAHVPLIAVHDYGRSACGDASDEVDWFLRSTGRSAYRVGTLIVLSS